MQITPKTEAEIKAGIEAAKTKFKPLPDGVYPFTVLESKEQACKKEASKNFGRMMAAIKLAVHGPDGRDQWVYDYFADWFSEWKLKHFCDTTGQADLYNSGGVDFAENRQVNYQGYVRLVTEVSSDGRERNVVDDYVAPEAKAVAPEKAKAGFEQVKAAADNTDDVPF